MVVLCIVLVLGLPLFANAEHHGEATHTSAIEQQIREAIAPLPTSLQAGATVVLVPEPGKRTVLREGTNGMICHADIPAPGFFVSCHPKVSDALNARFAELFAAGKSEGEMRDTLSAEVKEGKLQVEAGWAGYSLMGMFRKNAVSLSFVYVPNATTESTGLSTEVDHYRPWLMWAGTPLAHIMLPGE